MAIVVDIVVVDDIDGTFDVGLLLKMWCNDDRANNVVCAWNSGSANKNDLLKGISAISRNYIGGKGRGK